MKGFIKGACPAKARVHTKVDSCSMFEGKPHGLIFHDARVSYTPDEDIFNDEIQAAITVEGAERITPIMQGITDYQPTGGDVQTSQEGFGPDVPIGLNAKSVIFVINKGGLCLYKQLAKLNGQTLRVLEVDNTRRAYGTAFDQKGEERFRGFLCTVYVSRRNNTGSQEGAILLNVYYSVDYEKEDNNVAAIPLAEDIEGLSGVLLKRVDVDKAKFVSACSDVDLTDTYNTSLEDVTIYQDKSGANPATVTYNAADKTLTFAPTGGSYRVADAATLITANIEGYEGEDVYANLS